MAFGFKTGGGSRKGKPNRRSLERYESTAPYVPLALGVIVGLARRAESETTRLEAAKELLNRHWGKPSRQDGSNGTRVVINNQINAGGSAALPEGLSVHSAYAFLVSGRIDCETAAGLLAVENQGVRP